MALTEKGQLYTWGDQQYFQCGVGTKSTDDIEQPQRVPFFVKKTVKLICAGQFHSLALTNENELYSWGSGLSGRLGNGKIDIKGNPQTVVFG